MTGNKKSIGISFATQYLELLIQFLGVLVLARVLAPEEIGTFSVAAFLMTLLHVFRDFGVVQYIIQEHDLSRDKIRSAMGVSILLALAVACVMAACSGLVARFYGNAALQPIMWVMAASFAVSPFGSLLIGIYRRDFRLKAVFFIRIGSTLAQVTVSLVLALQGYGALSLAWGNFAGILAFGIVANLVRTKGIPRWPRFTNLRTILRFGGVSSLGNAANIAGSNLPDVVIGKAMDMAAVGYFSRANGMVALFTRLITSALLPLVLPYFAEIRRQGKDLRAPYLAAVEQLTALSWPFFAGLVLLAYPMVRALYGTQWDASVPLVQLLCLAGAVASVSLFASQVMVANGQVGDSTRFQLYTQPLRIGAVLVAANFGLMWVAGAIVLSELLTLAVVSRFLRITIGVGPMAVVRACAKSALVTICAAIVPLLVNLFWPDNPAHPWPPLLTGIFGAAVGWLGSMWLARHPLVEHLAPMMAQLKSGAAGGMPGGRLLAKALAYRSGLLGLYHRVRNRRQLTVVMFHRVLPATDPRRAGADPEWTMSTEAFRNCLGFFRRHYQIVTPQQVFAAQRGEAVLPPTSLLITFDDGWRDTAEYAQPILDELGLQALVFVAGAAIDSAAPFWEEHVYSFLATHADGAVRLAAACERCAVALPQPLPACADETAIRATIAALARLDRDVRAALLAQLRPDRDTGPAMLDAAQLVAMAAAGHTIGGHGMTHRPLTQVEELQCELEAAQASVAAHLGGVTIESMSLPHGAWTPPVLVQCRSAGYRYLFVSNAHLNALAPGKRSEGPLGRIHISERTLLDGNGRFEPSLLATWLFLRPSASPQA
jgi:O-antigen/teichoic acid export membrane protein/peptidoglycan/xylan/chitin deacetylase (PgdA/CDA1 family)